MAEQNSILLVDDEASVLRVLASFFEPRGFRVHRAGSGVEGIGLWERHQPDVTILDLHMPGMDGMDVLNVLAKRGAMVIILTGYGEVELAVQAMKLGAENFLTKPVDLEHLAAAVQKAAEKAALRRENVALRARLTPGFRRRMTRAALLVGLIGASAGIGKMIGGGAAADERPRNPIPVPLDSTVLGIEASSGFR